MDPNAALDEIRRICEHNKNCHYSDMNDFDRLCDLIEGLDQWLIRGGFLPYAWGLKYERNQTR